jgi:hypothetical protein
MKKRKGNADVRAANRAAIISQGRQLLATMPKLQDVSQNVSRTQNGAAGRRWTTLTDHLNGWAAVEVMWICTLATARVRPSPIVFAVLRLALCDTLQSMQSMQSMRHVAVYAVYATPCGLGFSRDPDS